MLTRILNTGEIKMEDDQIRGELTADLRRIDGMGHTEMPQGCNAYRVQVKLSQNTFRGGPYKFKFEIQYGKLVKDEFLPKGNMVQYQSETLRAEAELMRPL